MYMTYTAELRGFNTTYTMIIINRNHRNKCDITVEKRDTIKYSAI